MRSFYIFVFEVVPRLNKCMSFLRPVSASVLHSATFVLPTASFTERFQFAFPTLQYGTDHINIIMETRNGGRV